MNAYIYQSDLYCLACIQKMSIPYQPDSNDYPQGPFPNGSGEADTPKHCGLFLENPLTTDGEEYVRDKVKNFKKDVWVKDWKPFYSYLFKD